jgi:hypothetical protein
MRKLREKFLPSNSQADLSISIRLATSFYAEQLLDRDHYLDWITSGLEHSSQSKLPMWILIAQICWTDILRSRKYGRRLVYALLGHLNTVSQPSNFFFWRRCHHTGEKRVSN